MFGGDIAMGSLPGNSTALQSESVQIMFQSMLAYAYTYIHYTSIIDNRYPYYKVEDT